MVDFGQDDEVIETPGTDFGADDEVVSSATPIPQGLLDAYVGGKLNTQQKIDLEEDIKKGVWQLPEGIELGRGIFERTEKPGLLQRLGNMVTGKEQRVQETEALPEWTQMPLEGLWKSFKTAAGTLMTNPEETAQIIKSNYPEVDVRQDERGNYVLNYQGQDYAIKPGARLSDIPRFVAGMAAFTPAGRAATIPAAMGKAALTQAAIEGTQAATGGEFDVAQVPLAAATELVGRGIGKVLQTAKGPVQRSYARFIGQEVPEIPARAAVREAEAAGVPVMTSDVRPPQTSIGKLGQISTERIPFAGTGPLRAEQAKARVAAVQNLLRDYNVTETIDVIPSVADDLLKMHGRNLEKYSNMKLDVIDKLAAKGDVPVDNTLKVIDEQIAELRDLGSPNALKGISILEGFKDRVQNRTLAGLEAQRRELGNELAGQEVTTIKDTLQKASGKIYSQINKDMGDFIQNVGERRDYTKWRVGNARLAESIGELDSSALKQALKLGNLEPEKVRTLLFSKKPSQVQLLYKKLSPEGRANARIALLQEAAEKAGGVDFVSPERFKSSVDKLSKSTGVFFTGQDKKALDGLLRALRLTERAASARVMTESGAQAAPVVGAAVLADIFGGTGGGLAALGGIGGLARVYESAPVRNALIQLSSAAPGAETEIMKKLTTAVQAARQFGEEENGNE